jgi:anaerobic selenocysteine-containing dehydrogenase
MGHASERHDLMSQETQAARWIGFRQPILRVALEKQGKKFTTTYEAHEAAGVGQVWEEDEFWIELSWRVDPDGSLGIRKYFESPYEPGKKMTVEDYYGWIFENSVPGLPDAAAKQGLMPLEYMRKYGAFLIEDNVYKVHETGLKSSDVIDATIDPSTSVIVKNGAVLGIEVDGKACVGFPTPSRRLEFFSKTLKDWKWPEYSIPGYIKSQVHPENIDLTAGEMLLLPTFRLPTLIHTRSGNAKWLYEISNRNPLWINSKDAENFDVRTGDLLKVQTEIGYFIDKVWVTEGIKPGVIACSHHLGRWRLAEDQGGERWSTALVDLKQIGEGKWMMRHVHGIKPFKSDDPDSQRIFWEDPGVHQNLTFPVQPDYISGQHCWHQKVRVTKPGPEDRYGDVFVDTNKAHEVYKKWLFKTRPAPGPDNLRRPYWLPRSYKPALEAYYLKNK